MLVRLRPSWGLFLLYTVYLYTDHVTAIPAVHLILVVLCLWQMAGKKVLQKQRVDGWMEGRCRPRAPDGGIRLFRLFRLSIDFFFLEREQTPWQM